MGCDPVAQTGCATGEKCAPIFITEDVSITGCVADGTAALGEGCTFGAVGEATGFDNCTAGLMCLRGTCQQICGAAPNTCNNAACVQYEGLFEDRTDVGICAALCNPVTQDCPNANEGCYISLGTGESSCTGVPQATLTIFQDDACLAPPANPQSCYLNGCNKGYTINNAAQGMNRLVCNKLCSPVLQHTGDTTALQGDPNGVTCTLDVDPNMTDSHECRFINTFYSNTDMVLSTVGFCVNRENWYMGASCATMDLADLDNTFVPGCMPIEDLPAVRAEGRPKYEGNLEELIQLSEEFLQQSIPRQ